MELKTNVTDREGAFEEYRMLNSEMAFHRENTQRNRNYCLTLFTALVGFGITHNQPILFVIAWFLVLYFWRGYVTSNQHIIRISRYIAHFLEGDVTGLHWQTRVDLAGRETAKTRRTYMITRLTSPHAIMSLACMFCLLYYFMPHPLTSGSALCLTGLSFAALFVNVLLTLRISCETWGEMRNKWTRYWSMGLAEDEDNEGISERK